MVDGGPLFNFPSQVAVVNDSELIVADTGNGCLRTASLAVRSGGIRNASNWTVFGGFDRCASKEPNAFPKLDTDGALSSRATFYQVRALLVVFVEMPVASNSITLVIAPLALRRIANGYASSLVSLLDDGTRFLTAVQQPTALSLLFVTLTNSTVMVYDINSFEMVRDAYVPGAGTAIFDGDDAYMTCTGPSCPTGLVTMRNASAETMPSPPCGVCSVPCIGSCCKGVCLRAGCAANGYGPMSVQCTERPESPCGVAKCVKGVPGCVENCTGVVVCPNGVCLGSAPAGSLCAFVSNSRFEVCALSVVGGATAPAPTIPGRGGPIVCFPTFTCDETVAVPGNTDNISDPECARCARSAFPYYPCDRIGLCYCSSTPIPVPFLLPFTYCAKVVAVANNRDGLTTADCAVCNRGAYRYYPCESPDMLCTCDPVAGYLPVPPIPVVSDVSRCYRAFSQCATVVAVPQNRHYLTDDVCAACALGRKWDEYPCNRLGLCTCGDSGDTLPSDLLPSCGSCASPCIGACCPSDGGCSTSSCDANGLGDNAANCPHAKCTGVSGCVGRVPSCKVKCLGVVSCDGSPGCAAGEHCATDGASSNFKICRAHTNTTAFAAASFSTCSDVRSVPGNAEDVIDVMCSKCALGAVLWYPCNRAGLCYCNSGGSPNAPLSPFATCDRVEDIPGDKRSRLPDYACRRCRNGAHRHYPCLPASASQATLLCRCAAP